MPVVSIVVPVYNKEQYLSECIESILSQTLADLEVILINDGSTDSSDQVCEAYKRKDSRVSVYHQENKGVSSARNFGISVSKGSFIGFVDGDDSIETDMFELLVNNAKLANADISVCCMNRKFFNRVENHSGDNVKTVYDKSKGLTALLQGVFDWSANNKIYRRELLKDVRFKGAMNEDVLFTFYAFLGAQSIVFQNVGKYNYIVRKNSVSMTKFNAKYMETISVSREILHCIESENLAPLEEAKYLDLVKNISLMNLLVLSDKSLYRNEFKVVADNIRAYKAFIKSSDRVSKKHRMAVHLFDASPSLYSSFIRLYCLINKNDISTRV